MGRIYSGIAAYAAGLYLAATGSFAGLAIGLIVGTAIIGLPGAPEGEDR